ncbi:hypothetical protein K7864_25470 [Streptomyces sp. SP2-10]|nr:hypothetical protein [Streptomyces sp. SP2-10]
MPPVMRELTGSWLRRMTAPYGLTAQDLLRGILRGPHRVQVTGTPGTGLELFLNAPAQTAVARSVGLPLSRLTGLLPTLAAAHKRLVDDKVLRAAWYTPCEAWVSSCPACGRAQLPEQPVLVYPGTAGQVCRRHRRWLLADASKPASIALETLPEILAAHRHHLALMRTHPRAEQVVALAAAAVWSWQVQGWKSETVWQDRLRRLAAVTGCQPAAVEPHALLTYPETITLARLLSDPRWQQRLREPAVRGAGAAGLLLQELGRRVGRPWLADWLSAQARVYRRQAALTDPLQQWLLAAADGADGDGLWTVHQAASRPTEYSDRASFLTDHRPLTVLDEARAASLTGGWEPAGALTPA